VGLARVRPDLAGLAGREDLAGLDLAGLDLASLAGAVVVPGPT
jgi:hypothetical protein